MYLTTELRPRTVIRDSFPLMVEANIALGGFRDLFDRGSARQHFSPPVDAQGGHSFFRCRLGNGPSAGQIREVETHSRRAGREDGLPQGFGPQERVAVHPQDERSANVDAAEVCTGRRYVAKEFGVI